MSIARVPKRVVDDQDRTLGADETCPAVPSPWTPKWGCQLAAGHEGWHQALVSPPTALVEWSTDEQ